MPSSAPDLAACTRIVLGDMAIPSSVFNMRTTQSTTSTSELTPAQRSYMGNPAVVVVVVVGLSEIVLEAGAYTILFAVTVQVVEKAKNDVMDLAKRGFKKCVSQYTGCMATGLSNPFRGNHWTASHCNGCFERCQTDGVWPDAVGGKTCIYW